MEAIQILSGKVINSLIKPDLNLHWRPCPGKQISYYFGAHALIWPGSSNSSGVVWG